MVQDLKPGNLLMDENDQLVISDFGLAAVINSTAPRVQERVRPRSRRTARLTLPSRRG